MTEEKQKRYDELTRKHGDPWIWGIYLFLIAVSIVASYSASSREIAKQGIYAPLIKQCAFLAIGFAIVILVHRWDYNKSKFLITMIPVMSIISIGLLIYVSMFGATVNGATRHFMILGFSVQPAELAKLSIVTLLSLILARTQHKRDISWGGTILSGLAVGIYGGLLFLNGLTNTILLMVVSISMLIIGGISAKKFAALMVAYILMGGSFYLIKSNNDNKREVMARATTELAEHGPDRQRRRQNHRETARRHMEKSTRRLLHTAYRPTHHPQERAADVLPLGASPRRTHRRRSRQLTRM